MGKPHALCGLDPCGSDGCIHTPVSVFVRVSGKSGYRRPVTTADQDRLAVGRLTLGAALRTRRITAGITLAEHAEASGLSVSFLSDVERGRRLPSLVALDACAVALGTTARALLEGAYPWDAVSQPVSPAPPSDGRRRSK